MPAPDERQLILQAKEGSDGAFRLLVERHMKNAYDIAYHIVTDHADAQDMLRKASRISTLLVFNHIIAAIDAAVSAKLFNDRHASRLDTHMGLAWDPDGAAVPVVGVRWTRSR